MIVTIIGSLTKKKEMDEIKAFWEGRGAVVNSPGDPEIQKEPLVDIQRTWIEKIEEADFIIAIPKKRGHDCQWRQQVCFGVRRIYFLRDGDRKTV